MHCPSGVEWKGACAMIRLMCNSRTRKIRRMIFSAMTAFAILVQALSVSFESDAASTYVGGDIIFSPGSNWSGPLSISSDVFDGADYPASNTITSNFSGMTVNGTEIGSIGTSGVANSGELNIYFNREIPANSRIDVSLWLYIDTWKVSNSPPNYSYFSAYLENPDAVFDYNCSVSWHDFTQTGRAFKFNFSFWLQQEVEMISMYNFQLGFYFSPKVDSGVVSARIITQTTISYTPISDAYGDVLDQIEQNTGQTTDAINNQTQQVTVGYDNSQIVNDNQQLADAMQDYDNSQSAAVGDSTGYIDDVSFFDPSSSAQVMSGITLTGSFLQSLFENLGQWGAVVMVSLSLTFGLMLVGWFKFRK